LPQETEENVALLGH